MPSSRVGEYTRIDPRTYRRPTIFIPSQQPVTTICPNETRHNHPPRIERHPLRLARLVYSQYYNSTKEILDAAKTYPRGEKPLEGLTIHPTLHQQSEAGHAT